MNVNRIKRITLLSKLGRGSLVVSAVAGFAVCMKYGTRNLLAASHSYPKPETSEQRVNPFCTNGEWDDNWDSRQCLSADSVGNYKSTSKRHILLIRHGQYESDGETDSERVLTDNGRRQAIITGQRLNELKLPYITMVSSTMSRARETAQIIRQTLQHSDSDMPLVYDEILEEGAPNLPVPSMGNWKPPPYHVFQDSARIENAFRKYFYRADPSQEDDSYIVLVCHANVIRFFVCRALQFPSCGWIRMNLANCSLTMITINPDGLVLVDMMGDHGHIPPPSVTYF